jgi:hypothetical protein
MKMETEDEEDILEQEFSIPIDILTFDSPKSVFVVYKRNPDACPTGNDIYSYMQHISQILLNLW